uniref:AAA+ ATPase domain-containing protein n=1 Tax=Pseudotaxus chienii TaxID=89481 RepID=A0A481XFL8_9CONI|nr:hypothetical protein Ycf2 [Pseudotaxus chienii]
MKQKKTYLEKYPLERIPAVINVEKYRLSRIYYLFKVRLMGVFSPWTESNLVRLLTLIFSGRESVIKLFDFRILSTLVIRDIRLFILRGQAIKALIILTLPLLLFYFNSRSLFETNRSKDNLMRISPSIHIHHLGSQNLLLFPHMLMSLPKDKRRYQHHLLNPREDVWFFINSEINEYYKKKVIEWQLEYWDPNQEEEEEEEEEEQSVPTRPSRKLFKLSQVEEIEKRIKKFVELTKEIEKEELTKEIEEEEVTKEIEQEKVEEIKQLTEEIEHENDEDYDLFLKSEFWKGLIDNLSIDESFINISATTKKPIDLLKLRKRRQDALEYFNRSERNRIADLWKVKRYLQNRSANYSISSDPVSNIRRDINRFNCIRFVNQSLPSMSCSSCDQNKEQLKLNNDFHLKKIVLKIMDQFTLSITKPNQVYDNEIACDIDYNRNKSSELNKNILLNQIFNYSDKLEYNSFFLLLNILDKENRYVDYDKITAKNERTETSIRLILNQYKVKIFNYFEKRFKRFYLVKNALMNYTSSYGSNKNFLVSDYTLDKYAFSKMFQKYYLECKKIIIKCCFEWKELTNKFHRSILQMTRVYYQQDLELMYKYNLQWKELTKVLDRIYLIKRFSLNLKDQIQTNWIKKNILNNVTQDAINQHSSIWRKCQEEWLNHSILRTSRNINRNLNIYASSIYMEYLKKALKHVLFISKQNNLKNRVFDPIELFTINNFGRYGMFDPIELSTHNNNNFGWYETTKKIFGIILDELAPRDIESKSITSQKIDEGTIALLGLNEKPMNKSIIDLFDNEKNYMEFFDNIAISTIFNDRDNWLNPLKLSNRNSLRHAFCKANTIEFLDYLHHPYSYYKERLASYIERERIHIKNKNLTYGKLLNFVPTHKNISSFSIGEIRPFFSEKETISLIKSQVNILLAKYLRDQALIHDLYKSCNLLTRLNSFFHRKIYIYSIEEIYRIPLISKQIVNFDKSYRYPFLKSLDSKENNPFLPPPFDPKEVSYSNSSMSLIEDQPYQDDLLSEISFRMKNFAEKEKHSSAESSKKIIEDKVIGDKNAFLNLFNKEKRKIKILFFYKIPKIDIFEKWDLFQPYTLWFFTSTGWKYIEKSFLTLFPEMLITSSDQFVSVLDDIAHDWNHNLNIIWALSHQFWTLIKWEFRVKFLPKWDFFLYSWNLLDWKEPINQTVFRGKDTSISFDTWEYILTVREYDKPLYIFLGFFFFVSCIIYFLWLKFVMTVQQVDDLIANMGQHYYFDLIEKIKSYQKIRIYYNLNWYGFWLTFVDFIDQEPDPDDLGLLPIFEILYVKSNLKWFFRRSNKWHSLVMSYLYEEDGTDEFLTQEKVLFSVQERISKFESKLTPPSGFFSHYFEKEKHPGLRYLKYLAETIQLGLMNKIGIRKCELDSLSLAEKRVFNAFQHQINSVSTKRSLYNQVIFFPFYPAPSLSNRILLIGPRETGRSYLAKSLAADSYLPLIKISPKTFLEQDKLLLTYVAEHTSTASKSYLEHEEFLKYLNWTMPEDEYDKEYYQQKPKHWHYQPNETDVSPEFLGRRFAQFQLALQLAKLMSPCVIWIPNIHEMDDFMYITALLIELLGDTYGVDEDEDEERNIQQNIVVIASTNIPKKLDPSLISPLYRKRRFDTFINTKMCPAPHREKEFTLLLRNRGLYLKKEWNSDNFFGLMTSGFNTRDMVKLANYVWRIGIHLNTSVIGDDITGYALYRSRWIFCNYDFDFYGGVAALPYKIGRAIIQNKLTYPKHFLNIKREVQGARAYCLSEWYLEPSIAGTAVKELTIFYHMVGCLAGSAAQDCWFTSESNRDNWTSLSDLIANDFILASNLLQSLLEEFPGGAIFRGNYDQNHITIAPQFKRDMMQKGLSSQLDELVLYKELRHSYREVLGTSIVCSPRTWRLSFVRSNRFDHIQDITIENPFLDYLRLFGEFKERPTHISSLFWVKFLASRDPLDIYHDTTDVPRRKLAAFWEARSLYNRFQKLGIYQFDTEEDATEYKPLDTPIIYIGPRFLWDPVSIRFQNKDVAFLRGELFTPHEIVKRIYVTYALERRSVVKGATIITLKSIVQRKRIRKIALGIKFEIVEDNSDLPPNMRKKKMEDIETFKRFQEVGVRLRRLFPYPTKVLHDSLLREKTRDDNFRLFLLERERENRDLLYNECFIHNTLSEIYEYLSNIFISNTMLLKQIENRLFQQTWLSTNDITSLVAEGLNKI